MRRLVGLCFASLALAACASSPTGGPGIDAPARDVVRRVWLDLIVPDASHAARALRARVAEHEGYVEMASQERTGASFVVRVPSDRLDAFRHEAHGLGDVSHEHETSEDVRAVGADLDARTRAARAEETRLLALLASHGATLADVLAIEARLTSVRERIERLEAEGRAHRDAVTYARVEIAIATRTAPFWERPFEVVAAAATFGMHVTAAVAVGLAAILASFGPLLVLLAVAAWLLRSTTYLAARRWKMLPR